jgi:hypothetical protein
VKLTPCFIVRAARGEAKTAEERSRSILTGNSFAACAIGRKACMATGGAEGALARLDEALALARETGAHWSDAFLHRVRGEILRKRDPANTAPAEEAFLTSIAIAQQKKARSFELRATLALARLWRDQGKRNEAHGLLAPVYGWFTEGLDTLDLKEAKALLGRVADVSLGSLFASLSRKLRFAHSSDRFPSNAENPGENKQQLTRRQSG